VEGERPRRKLAERRQCGGGRVGGERLAGGDLQAELAGLLALPLRGQPRLDPEPGHLARLEQRRPPERAGQGVQAARQGKRVR
jgi:hypothetical protein